MGSRLPDKSDQICEVCRGLIMPFHEILILIECRHIFHLLCIDSFMEFHRDCPQCWMEKRRN